MPRGGARPGAGMPKGYKTQKTRTKEEMKERLRQQVFDAQDDMTRAQIEAGKGLNLLIVRDAKSGKFIRRVKSEEELDLAIVAQDAGLETLEIWAKEPGTAAYAYLMDQAIDKPVNPKQEIEVGFKDLGDRIRRARERVQR